MATHDLKHHGIGVKQSVIIRHLAHQGKQTLTALSRATMTDLGATCRAVEALVKRGWLSEQVGRSDRRCREVALSAKGKRLAGQIERIYVNLAKKLAHTLSPSEKKSFSEKLVKIADALAMERLTR